MLLAAQQRMDRIRAELGIQNGTFSAAPPATPATTATATVSRPRLDREAELAAAREKFRVNLVTSRDGVCDVCGAPVQQTRDYLPAAAALLADDATEPDLANMARVTLTQRNVIGVYWSFNASWLRSYAEKWTPMACVSCTEKAQRAEEEIQRQRREREVKDRVRGFVQVAAVPPFVTTYLKTFTPTGRSLELRQTVDRLLDDSLGFRVLLIVGPPGNGKSIEAGRAIVERATRLAEHSDGRFLSRREFDDRFVNIADLLDQITETYHKEAPRTKRAVLDEYRKAGLLVLDDVGVHEIPTPHTVEVIHSIIDHRCAHMLPTIITSNKFAKSDAKGPNLAELGGYLSKRGDDAMQARRIIDRLDGYAHVFRITTASFRPELGRTPFSWRSEENPSQDDTDTRQADVDADHAEVA